MAPRPAGGGTNWNPGGAGLGPDDYDHICRLRLAGTTATTEPINSRNREHFLGGLRRTPTPSAARSHFSKQDLPRSASASIPTVLVASAAPLSEALRARVLKNGRLNVTRQRCNTDRVDPYARQPAAQDFADQSVRADRPEISPYRRRRACGSQRPQDSASERAKRNHRNQPASSRAARSDMAAIVRLGGAEPQVGNTEEPTTIRLRT
jgi:hypothetical protein